MAKKPIRPDARLKKMPVNSKWFQNVSKSMGFAAADLVKELVPATSDLVIYNSSDIMDLTQTIRNNVTGRKTVNSQFKNIPAIRLGKDALQNALSDIKSGKIVNNDRANQFDFDEMESMFGDFDNQVEFNDENADQGQPVQNNTINAINTMPLARAIVASQESNIEAMEAVANQHLAIETEKMMFNHKQGKAMLAINQAMNDNLQTLVKFHGDSTSKYYAASIKYYEESLDELKLLTQAQKNAMLDKAADAATKHPDLYTYSGGVKLSGFKEMVQKNLQDIKDENAALSSLSSAVSSKDFLSGIAKDPIGTLIKTGMRSVVPVATKTALQAIDASMSSMIPAVMAKINSMDDSQNPINKYIAKILGTKGKLSYDVNLGEYQKGAVPWDGECKKALTEVLPGYLARIESALTGHQERTFNYSTGKFSGAKDIKKAFKDEMTNVENSGYTEVQTKMRNIAREMKANQKVMDQFEKDMQEYFSAMTKKGSVINPYKTNKNGVDVDVFAQMGLFGGNAGRQDMMRNVMKGLSVNDMIKMSTQGVYESRKQTQNLMDEIRKNPNMMGYNLLANEGLFDKNGKLKYDPSKGGRSTGNCSECLHDIKTMLARGIRVYTDTNPNMDMLSGGPKGPTGRGPKGGIPGSGRFSTDSSNRTGRNYGSINSLSKDELQAIYDSANKGSQLKDNFVSKKLGGKTTKLNDYLNTASNVLDYQMFRMLFGDEIDNQIKGAQNKEAFFGMVSNDKKKMSGILNSTIGYFQDTIKGVGSYFTGNAYTKHDGTKVEEDPNGLLKKMSGFMTGSVDKLLGESGSDDKGILGRFAKDFMDGYRDFKVSMFGEGKLTDKDRQETLSQLTNKVKDRLPKAIGAGLTSTVIKTTVASKMGLMGSLLMPGGPIGAAVMGTAFGFMAQSDTFKNWLFGEKDPKGVRMGGFLPKSFTDALSAHGGTVKAGAMIGGGVGLLPSFFLPGGPITGAVLGVGSSLMTKTDSFQEFLYGKDFKNKDVKKSMMNGAFGKLYNKTLGKEGKKVNPKLAAFLGTGGMFTGIAQGVGLLPSFLLPGGPIAGAMLGLAGGIAASSDKFQQFLFGEKDIDGKRYGGVMTKFTNWFDTTVVSPFKMKATEINDNIYAFVKGKIVNPFLDAFQPLTSAFKYVVDDTKNAMKETWTKISSGVISKFDDNVIKPFGASLEKYVVNPLKKSFNSMLTMVGKGLGAIVSSPFKMLTKIGDMADSFNARHAISDERKSRRQAYREDIQSRSDAGTLGLGDVLRGLNKRRIRGSEREDIINTALPYRATRAQDREDRNASLQAEIEARRAKRAETQKQYEEDVKFGKESNWKYASSKQKAKREEDLKNKQNWMQEKIKENSDDTVKKLSTIEGLLDRVPNLNQKQVDLLTDMKDLLKDNLKKMRDGGGLIGSLRNNDQSHEDGLDEVPKDGYVAELHEGEMVVPKRGAGFLKSMFGGLAGKAVGGAKNAFAQGLNFLGGGRGNAEHNAMGLSADQMLQMNEMQDLQRYNYASRKDVDFMNNMFGAKKKAKEEKKWKDKLIGTMEGTTKAVEKGNSFWDNMFGPNGMLGKFINGFPGLLNGLAGALGGLGSTLMSALPAAVVGILGNQFADEAQQRADKWGSGWLDSAFGYGDEGQLTADGEFMHNNALSMSSSRFAYKGARDLVINKPLGKINDNIVKPTAEAAKGAWTKAAPTVNKAVTKGKSTMGKALGAVDNYINPKMTRQVTGVLGTTSKFTGTVDKSLRKGVVQKGIGGLVDVAKESGIRSKNMVNAILDLTREALTSLNSTFVKKWPTLGKWLGKADGLLSSLAKNADDVVRKFGTKIAIFVGDGAADFIPVVGQVTELAMTAYDAITGFSAGNAGNLFQMPEDKVDMTMRTISSLMQAACKFSWFAVIWLVNEMCSSLYDTSFLAEIASWVYTAVPKLFGKPKLDLSKNISNKQIDQMSMEEAIRAAGGNPEAFKDSKGNFIDPNTMSKSQLEAAGISDREANMLSRRLYNEVNGTKMDSQGWADKTSQTFGQKVMNNKSVKNFMGSFKQSSIKGHTGINTDAKLSMGDRAKYLVESTAINTQNWFRKLMGKEEINKQEAYASKIYDENGKKVGLGKGTLTYAEAREVKLLREQEEALKKQEKYESKAASSKTGIGKWWNNVLAGKQKKKADKKGKQIGTRKEESLRSQQLKNKGKAQYGKNTASQENYLMNDANVNDFNMMYANAQMMQQHGVSITDEGYAGKGDSEETTAKKKATPKKTEEKKKTNPITSMFNKFTGMFKKKEEPKKTTSKKSTAKAKDAGQEILDNTTKQVDKSFAALHKGVKKMGTTMTKGLTKNTSSLNKAYGDISESVTKLTKSTIKTFKKDVSKKYTEMNKFTKSLLQETRNVFYTLDKKVKKVVDDIKDINVTSVNNASPTFTMNDPKSFLQSMIDQLTKSIKSAGEAGTEEATGNLATSQNTESGTMATTNNNFTFYSQNDRKWAGKQMGASTMGKSGCGPTSMAMAMSQATGMEITPDKLLSEGRKYLPGYSTYQFFPEMAKKYAMNYQDTNNTNEIVSNLKAGRPVMLSGRSTGGRKGPASPYTKEGHVVVANAIKGDRVFVSDPRGKNYSRSYSLSELTTGMNKAMMVTPTMETKKKVASGFQGIPGINPQYDGSGFNYEINNTLGLSPSMLKQNMGQAGEIRMYEKVLAYAKTFLNKVKYIYGSKGLDNNKLTSDCSGFTHHVFERSVGIDIGHGSASQRNAGTSVAFDKAQPGDLVVFSGHVGIVWSTDNEMIDIGSGIGPVIRKYDTSYWMGRKPVIRRVLSEPNKLVDTNIAKPCTALGINSVNGLNLGDLSGAAASGANTDGTQPTAEQAELLGVFSKMGKYGTDMITNIFNGSNPTVTTEQTDPNGSAGKDTATGGSGQYPNAANGWAYYAQVDPRWNTKGIGNGTVKDSGCGPTSLSMMLSTMSGQQINPATMSQWGWDNKLWDKNGMKWSMPNTVSNKFGVAITKEKEGNTKANIDAIKEEIKAGRPVVMSGRAPKRGLHTPFTPSGHIVLGVGVDGQNRIIVNDPRGMEYTKAYDDSGFTGTNNMRKFWAFSKTNNLNIPAGLATDGAFNASGGSTAAASSTSGSTPDPLGVFTKMSQFGQNFAASVFNGKEVDLFAAAANTSDDVTGGSLAPGSAGDYLGTHSAVYETGKVGGDPGMVSNGAGDPLGGISYGIPQYSTKQGSAKTFANWIMKQDSKYSKYFSGKTPGTAAFGNAWKQAYADNGWEFGAYQVAKAHEDYYTPWSKAAAKAGIDTNQNRAIQEAVYSTGVQHGGASFNKYGTGLKGKSNVDMIEQLYQNRINKATVRSSSLRSRWNKEKEDMKKLVNQPGIAYGMDAVNKAKGTNAGNAGQGGSAGMGDGFMITPENMDVTSQKPVSNTAIKKLNKYGKAKQSAGMGDGPVSTDKVKKTMSTFAPKAKTSAGAIKGTGGGSSVGMTVDVLIAIMDELEAIRLNTAATAQNTKEIQIVSANTPVNAATTAVQPNKTTSTKPQAADSNTGYNIAKNIAAFK